MTIYLFIAFVLVGVSGAIAAKKLTIPASLTGGMVATFIFAGVGWIGIALLTGFFLLGTLTTSWGKNYKQGTGIVKNGDSQRTVGQVLANGGIAGVFGLLAFVIPGSENLFLFLMAAAFSSAASDTVSSELGSVYGSRFYDILSFKKGARGENGIVSVEGTALGVLASCVIASIYALGAGWDERFFYIIIAGTIGNLSDSVLGATVERKNMLGNNAVNLLNTCVAAVAGYLLVQL